MGQLGVLAVAAPLMLGGAPVWAELAIAMLSALSCAAAAWMVHRRGEDVPYGALVLLPVVLLGFTALQAMPIPCWLAEVVHADAARAARDAAALVGRDPWCAASIDPGATTQRLLQGTALACTFIAASTIAGVVSRETVIAVAAVACTVTAVVVIAHVLAGAQSVYGWFAPSRGGHAVVTGPFVNPNNAGGVLVLGAALASGLATEARAREGQAAWIAAASVCAIAAVATLSRGAILSLAAVMIMLIWALALRPRKGRRTRRWPWPVLVMVPAALAGAVVGSEAAFAHIQSDMLEGGRTKIALVGRAFESAILGPWLGVGRGAFSASFTRQLGTLTRFEHAENFVAEWSVEWGAVVGPAVVIALAVAVARAAMRAESAVHRAAVVGVVGYGLSNLVDLGVELLGSAVPAAVVLAAVTARHGRHAWRVLDAPRATRAIATASVVALAGTAVLAGAVLRWDLPSSRAELERLAAAGDRDAFAQLLADAVVAHPHEAALTMVAAQEASAHDDPAALRWVNRAMVLAPYWVSPHALAARWMYLHRRDDQAELELREIARREPSVAVRSLCALQRVRPRSDTVLRVLGDVSEPALHVDVVASCIASSDPAAEDLDRWVLERDSTRVAPRTRVLHRRLVAGEAAAVVAEVATLGAEERSDPRIRILLARARFALGDADGALRALDGTPLGALAPDAATLRARIHSSRGNTDGTREALEELQGLARGDVGRAAGVELLRGELHEAARRRGQALQAYEHAHRLVASEQSLRGIIRCATALGDEVRLRTATGELCERAPTAHECAERPRAPGQRVSGQAPSLDRTGLPE